MNKKRCCFDKEKKRNYFLFISFPLKQRTTERGGGGGGEKKYEKFM